eukprot:SAG11_NODE_267_length_11457_cov_14.773728_8_plen_406_part_00
MQAADAMSTNALPEQPRSAAGSSKRPAADQPPLETDTDRLIEALLQDRAEARAAAAAQQALIAEQLQLGKQQLAEIAELRRAAATPPNIVVQPPAVTVRAAPHAAAQPTGAAAAATEALPSAVQVLVDRAVDDAEAALHTANRARVAKDELEKLVIDVDPAKALPDGTPKACRAISASQIKMPNGVTDDSLMEEVQVALATCARATQIEYVRQLLRTKVRTIAITGTHLADADNKLGAAVDSLLSDTVLTTAQKRMQRDAALAMFAERRNAVISEIEATRKEQLAARAEKARLLEEAKLKSLETNNFETIGALVDAKILANEVRRRGSDTIDLEEVDVRKLQEENAAAHQSLFQHAPQSSALSRRGRTAKSQPKPKKPGKKPAARGKGSGNGKGKSKRGGGRGGR